jgi:hypothetical protein
MAIAPLEATAEGYVEAPFREYPVAVAQAAALERIEIAARALAIRTADKAKDDDDDADGMAEDLVLFQASLAAAAPELEANLVAAIDDLLDAAEAGQDPGSPSAEVIEFVAQARAALVPPEAEAGPGFHGAVAAWILLEDGGVAEGYEEAVEGEAGAYEIGWVALQRVKAIWEGFSDRATEAQAADVAEVLAVLDELFPSEAPPEVLFSNPEQAEAPAHQLVGLLEAVTDADLYPGRDLAAATGLVAEVASQGCASLASGEDGIGLETLTIAAVYFDELVERTLRIISPDVSAEIEDHFEGLDPDDSRSAADTCDTLLAALAAGQEALTP